MKNIYKLFSLVSIILLTSTVVFAQANLDDFYTELKPVQPTQSGDKVEVIEIFWYGCPHCYTFEPYINRWNETKGEDVVFRRMPGVLGQAWVPHAKAFYTAEKLGVTDIIHEPLFTAIHKDRKRIFNDSQIRDFFLEMTDVSAEEFNKVYNSKEIDIKIRQALSAQQKARLTGVPAVIVNGKYLTSASQARSNDNLIKVIESLVDKER
jgi:thiol:disulfide interchange protein DsbA